METEPQSFWEIGAQEGMLHQHLPALLEALDWVSAAIDLFAVLLLVIGALRFVVGVARSEVARDGTARVRGMNRQRMELGRYILAALELLIVSDIIHTAITLAVADLVYLGLLVVIRSLISYFLDRELGQLRQELGEGPSGPRS
jgi:uncharacterized membrane protein